MGRKNVKIGLSWINCHGYCSYSDKRAVRMRICILIHSRLTSYSLKVWKFTANKVRYIITFPCI